MTVIVISSWHNAFDGRIFYKECRTLAEIADVYLFTPGINGKITGMDGSEYEEGIYNRVHCHSLHTRARKRGLIQKVLRKIEQFSGIEKNKIFRQVMKSIKKNELLPNVIHVHEPDVIPVARRIADKYSSKVIFDSHEMHIVYPIDRFKKPGAIMALIFFFIYKHYATMCDATVSVNDYIRSFLLCLNPDIENVVIENTSILQSRVEYKRKEKILLVHEGNLSFSRGLKMMCDVFTDEWMNTHCSLRYIGMLGSREKSYIENQPDRVKSSFIDSGWVEMRSLEKVLYGDIGLILMEPRYNNLLAGPPNKLYNYLAMGIPVLTVDLPASRRIVERYGVGEVCMRDYRDIIDKICLISENIEQYRKRISEYRQEFLWPKDALGLTQLYGRITAEKN